MSSFKNTNELILKINEHAERVGKNKKGLYENQDPSKFSSDAYYGKLAEWAVYGWLKSIGIEVNSPDMRVLNSPTWNSDLIINNKIKCAVKSCLYQHLNTPYEYSWTFQAGGRRRDPILDNQSDEYLIVFVQILNEKQFEIYGISTSERLNKSNAYIFEDGIDKSNLKGLKLFVKAKKVKPDTIDLIQDVINLDDILYFCKKN